MTKPKTRAPSASGDAPPPVEGNTPPSEVDAATAAKAKAEVDAARNAPRDTSSPPTEQPRKRGRPPGSKNKVAGVVATTTAETIEPQEDATPEDFADLVDMFNLFCKHQQVEPVTDDERKDWSRKAAKVANRWGGQIPLMPEIALLISTGMIFGPRVLTIVSPENAAKLKALEAKAKEAEHNAKVEADASRDRKISATSAA